MAGRIGEGELVLGGGVTIRGEKGNSRRNDLEKEVVDEESRFLANEEVESKWRKGKGSNSMVGSRDDESRPARVLQK